MVLGCGLAIYLEQAKTYELDITWMMRSRIGSRILALCSISGSAEAQAITPMPTPTDAPHDQMEESSISAGQSDQVSAVEAATVDKPIAEESTIEDSADSELDSAQPIADDPIADPYAQPPSEEELLAGITAFRSEMAVEIPEAEKVAAEPVAS